MVSMKKNAVTFAQLTARLERAIHADVGLQGLNILLYGWMQRGGVSRTTLFMRKKSAGEEYLTPEEVRLFSLYAGYDLSKG